MNCKQGDLAVVVKATNPQNIGRIVSVLRPWIDSGTWVVRHHGRPAVTGIGLYWEPWCFDYELRPIRDIDGQDEMLRLVGLPAGTPQAA